MPITVSSQAGSATITLSGEIDHHGARAMMEQLEDAIARALPLRLTLDLSGVTFMDSSGIGLVMGRYRMMKTMDGELLVTGASPRVKRLMQMGGLDKLPIFGGSVRPEKA